MKKIILFLFISLHLFAEEVQTSQTIIKGDYQRAKKDYTLEMVLAAEQVKDSSYQVTGSYTSLKLSFLYTLNSLDEFRLYTSAVSEHYRNYRDDQYMEFGEVMYRRKSLLNYADHGVNLDFELKHGIVLDQGIRKYWGFDSETIPQIVLKTKLPHDFGLEFKARHHFYQRNTHNLSTPAHEDRLYLSTYKMFSHQYIFNTELKYRHKIYPGKHYSYSRNGYEGKNHEDLVLHPSLMYFLTRSTLLEGYVETKLNDTFDNRPFKQLIRDELIVGTAIYFTIL